MLISYHTITDRNSEGMNEVDDIGHVLVLVAAVDFIVGVFQKDKLDSLFYFAIASLLIGLAIWGGVKPDDIDDTPTDCHAITVDGVAYVQVDCVEQGEGE